ncbi:MAG: RDD family protein [Candidatus Acidiferrales bacterium]
MFCSKCGAGVADGAAFCSQCGQTMGSAQGSHPGLPPSMSAWNAAAHAPVKYAGFWLRFVAYFIDSFAIGIVLGLAVILPLMGTAFKNISPDNPWEFYTAAGPQLRAAQGLMIMGTWLYYALFESSAWRATLGKKALGLEVTDLAGNRLSFARASGRFFAKYVSFFTLLIGFIMAGFTAKKQALHDIIAACLVIRKI